MKSLIYSLRFIIAGICLALNQVAHSASINVVETYFDKSGHNGVFTVTFQYEDSGLSGVGREVRSVDSILITLLTQFTGGSCCFQPETIVVDNALAGWGAILDNGNYTGFGQTGGGVKNVVPDIFGSALAVGGLSIRFDAWHTVTAASGGAIHDNCGGACAGFGNQGRVFNSRDENNQIVAAVITPAVPIPAAVWLFCSGLLGLVGLARCKMA